MLLIHVISAVITLSLCVYSWFRVAKNITTYIWLSTILSTVSGFMVAFNNTGITKSFCVKIGAYLLMISLTQYRLYTRSIKTEMSKVT